MSFPAASLPEDLDLEALLGELFRRLREVCPDCAADLPDCDEVELARRIVAAVTESGTGSDLAAHHLPQAEKAVADLLAADDPEALLEHDPRFGSPLPARLLIREARSGTALGQRDALRLAALAVEAAERIDTYLWGKDYARATLIQARCARVDALRVAGDSEGACHEVDHLLEMADHRLSLRLRGDIHLLAGQLRRDQGDFEAAAALLFVARDSYETAEDEPRLGRTLLELAEIYREHGQVDLAVDAARRAATLLDPARDRRAHLAARHNLAIYLCDAGHPIEARAELETSRGLHGPAPPPAVTLGSSWIEGRIHEQIGDTETAERLYREVQQGFLAARLPADAALAGLDLAWLLIERRRFVEADQVGAWIVLLASSYHFPSPVVAALLAFREALEDSSPAHEHVLRCLDSLRTELRRSSRR